MMGALTDLLDRFAEDIIVGLISFVLAFIIVISVYGLLIRKD